VDELGRAELVRSGELSARESIEAAIERIERLNPELNAVVTETFELALSAADSVDPAAPFAGVPFLVKDLIATCAGVQHTAGSSFLRDHVAEEDTELVARLKGAGICIVGVTNTAELGNASTAEPHRFGPTRNPWARDRIPGGSSGGSAAAVAAGLVPAAHGNDGGGSLRIPAACCGLVGLKPARGRISSAPERGEGPLDIDGVLTHTVADTAAILDVLAGYETGDTNWAPPPSEPFATSAGASPGKLRIAMTTLPPIPDATVDGLCARAVADAAELLRSLGHEVEEVELPWRTDGLRELFGVVFGIQLSLSMAASGIVAGVEPAPEDMEPMSWAIFSLARELNAMQGAGAATQLQRFSRRLAAFLDPYDALLTPALAERPLPIGTLDTAAPDPMSTFTRSSYFTPFTASFNAGGQPGISLPLFHGEDGLPLGVQLVGRPAGEAALLALAAQLEQARPWVDRRPPVAANA
jgi:amidase